MIGERWQQILEGWGSAPAIHHPGGVLTFAMLDRLARAHPDAGDHVLAQGHTPDLLMAVLAGFIRGKPVHVVEQDRARRVPAMPVPKGTCLIKQTVGGSGHRRCQFFTAAQLLADVDRLHAALHLAGHGVVVAAISPAHSYGLTVTVLQTLLHGVPMHWVAEPFPSPLKDALRQHERVFLPGTPGLWKAWLHAGVDLGNVTLAVSAGSPLSLELERQAFDAQGLKLHNLYGTSECGAVTYDASDQGRTDGRLLGTLLPGVQAAVDPTGRLTVRSDATGIGYDETLPGERFGDGSFTTCDRAELTRSGLLFLGSVGAGINVAGRKLSPDEIAAKLRLATGVEQIAVHGKASRDPERCQEVVATVGLPPEEMTQEFRKRACADLAPWEVPRQWVATGCGG